MGPSGLHFSLLVFLLHFHLTIASPPRSCDYNQMDTCKDGICYFTLIIQSRLTMMKDANLTVPHEGKIYDSTDEKFERPITDGMIQADGYYQNPRRVIVANNCLPGPTITVYEGQTVNVKVVNELTSEGVTLHFHGVVQKGTNLMDGVAFINQCPILPEQSFEYEFDVHSPGTDFYHAHIGAQRTQGLYGAFITKPKIKKHIYEEEEHIMIVNDWNHDYDSNTGHLMAEWGMYEGTSMPRPYFPAPNQDNSLYSTFKWHSGLINGRGRYYHYGTRHNNAALTVYTVPDRKTSRFRVINAGTMYPLRVSVDRHDLQMIATDGYDFDNETVESFILSPGERFDFLLTANDLTSPVKRYWIYAETLQDHKDPAEPVKRAEAILQYSSVSLPAFGPILYDDNNTVAKHSSRDRCFKSPHDTVNTRCKVLNCPFEKMQDIRFRCIDFTNISSAEEGKPLINIRDKENVKFLNFGFPSIDNFGPGSINGRQWKYPPFSAASQRTETEEWLAKECPANKCGSNQICKCTNSLKITPGSSYQFVLTNIGNGSGYGHPVHLHGHSFQVIRQGYANDVSVSNQSTRFLKNPPHLSDDVKCVDDLCTKVDWRRDGFGDTLLAKSNPINKDTVMVPTGGYVVIRFTADNPGIWFMHCHIELHNLGGMAMMLVEMDSWQSLDEKVPVHPLFPQCRSYDPHKLTSTSPPDNYDKRVNVPVLSAFLGLFALLWIITFICCGCSKYCK